MSAELATLDLPALTTSYRQELQSRHAELQRNKIPNAVKVLRDVAGYTRGTAQILLSAKANLSPEQFDKATDFLSDAEIKYYVRYIKFGELIDDPNSNLPELVPTVMVSAVIAGAIPMPEGHGPQQLHESNFYVQFPLLTQAVMGRINDELKDHPLTSLRRDQLISLAAATEPIALLHQRIKALIQ